MNGAAPRYERPALTKHQQVVAQAVATILEPVLKEMDRKLDRISDKLDILLAELAVVIARVEEVTSHNGAKAQE
jgi:hypothetical protein